MGTDMEQLGEDDDDEEEDDAWISAAETGENLDISHDEEKENPDSADDDEEDKRTQHQSRQQRAK